MTLFQAKKQVETINRKWEGPDHVKQLELEANRLNEEEEEESDLRFGVMAYGASRWHLVVGDIPS